ncbi:MAG: tetratricopeptide repeat protein, partial [Anaerolineales bacterium]|nr:tetratricopeptide repeat protein [Anaerolineales bacterium]
MFAGVPALRPHFVGRDHDLTEIVSLLTAEANSYVAVVGMPGVGKSTLATALAHHRALLEHFKDGVLWASVGPPEQADVMTTLAAWGNALGADLTQFNEPETRREAVKQLVGDRAMVVVLDDIWVWEQAQALLCGGPHCVHLLTTRDMQIAQKFAGKKLTYPLKTLPDTEAKKLLEAIAPEVCAAHPADIDRLVDELDGLPLSLELVGSFLASDERNLFPDLFGDDKPLEEVDEPVERLALLMESDKSGAKRSLADILKLSLDHLPSEAVMAFYELGAFAPTPASFSLPAAEYVTQATKGTLALLAARSLIEVEGPRMFLHQTLAELARTKMPPEAPARHRAYYLELVNKDNEAWRAIEPEYEQITWGFQHNPDDESLLEWIWAMSMFQNLRGLRREQIGWMERGLVVTRRDMLKEAYGILLNNLAALYDSLGQREKALEYLHNSALVKLQLDDQRGLAATLINLGSIYDDHAKAFEYLERAFRIFEELDDKVGLAETLTKLGNMYNNPAQREQALEYYEQALRLFEEAPNPGGVAKTLNTIGLMYTNMSNPEKALEYYMQALPIQEEVGDLVELARTWNNMGWAYENLSQPVQALAYYEQALPIVERGTSWVGFVMTMNNVARMYRETGNPVKALETYERLLPNAEGLGDWDEVIKTLNHIAMVYQEMGNPANALETYERLLSICLEI